MRTPIKRLCNYCSYYSRWFWKCHHVRFLACYGIAVVGLILGILVAVNREGETLTINYLELMSTGAFSVFGMFFKQCLLGLLMFALVFICIFHAKIIFIGYLILFFVGYSFGGGCVNVITCNTMLGIIYLIIFLIPVNLITLTILNILICGIRAHLHQYGAYKKCSIACKKTLKILIKKFCITYVCLVVIYIPFMVVIPCIAQSIMFGFS